MGISVEVGRVRARRARLYVKAVTMPQGALVFDPALRIKGLAGGGLVFVEATKPIPILGMGRRVRGALRELGANLVWVWRAYVEVKEEELPEDAKELACRLRTMARWEDRGWPASASG